MQSEYFTIVVNRNLGDHTPTGPFITEHELGLPLNDALRSLYTYQTRELYYERARYLARRDYHLRADRSIRR